MPLISWNLNPPQSSASLFSSVTHRSPCGFQFAEPSGPFIFFTEPSQESVCSPYPLLALRAWPRGLHYSVSPSESVIYFLSFCWQNYLSTKYISLISVVLVSEGTGDWTQSLVCVRQTLYHIAISPVLSFLLSEPLMFPNYFSLFLSFLLQESIVIEIVYIVGELSIFLRIYMSNVIFPVIESLKSSSRDVCVFQSLPHRSTQDA